jgi:hypothetical protein
MDSGRPKLHVWINLTLPHGPSRMFVAPTTYREVDSRLCVFCGSDLAGRRSREHIFPKWLLRHRDASRSPYRIDWSSDATGALFGERELGMGSLVAGRVCRDCNAGWMSRLEQDSSGLLRSLVDGERALRGTSSHERELLARWGTKTAFASRSADLSPQLVDPLDMRALAEGKMPRVAVLARQAAVDVGLGVYATQRWLVSYPSSERASVEHRVGRSHRTVLLLGRLLLGVCFWPDDTWPIVISQKSHVALWPTHGSWRTYAHATDRHGVPPTRETELIDFVIGSRVSHPSSQLQFEPMAADRR